MGKHKGVDAVEGVKDGNEGSVGKERGCFLASSTSLSMFVYPSPKPHPLSLFLPISLPTEEKLCVETNSNSTPIIKISFTTCGS